MTIQHDQGAGQALEQVRGTGTAVAGQPNTLRDLIASQADEIKRALPRTLSAERFVRIVQTELRKNPVLARATQASFLGAVLTAAQLGLEFGPVGRAYMVPFKNRKTGTDEIQLIIGYKGWLDLIHRSGELASISAREVRENDTFSYQFGLNEDLIHVPASGERGAVTHYYCVAKTKNGGVNFAVMSHREVAQHRDRYAKKVNGEVVGPWKENFDEMALKTVFKKVYTWLPMSTELAEANAADEGMIYRASLADVPEVIDVESEDVVEAAPAPTKTRNVRVRAGKTEIAVTPKEPEVVDAEIVDTDTGEVLAAPVHKVVLPSDTPDGLWGERMERMRAHAGNPEPEPSPFGDE